MNCEECSMEHRCEKPYEVKEEYQMQYLGREYTKVEWEREGVCAYFKPIETIKTLITK